MRIFTGAPMPEGADSVVVQEDARREGAAVVLQTGVSPGENVRARGSTSLKARRCSPRAGA